MPLDLLPAVRFYGIDSIIELLIIVVAAIISYQSYRIYKLIKENNFKYFSIAFLLIAISFVFKILSNLTIIHQVQITTPNLGTFVFTQLQNLQLFNFFSFIIYKITHLVGFLTLFFIATQTKNKEKIFLFIYLSILVVLFSVYFNFIFDLTLVFILLFLTAYFYKNYKENKSRNAFLVFIGFLAILISHLLFIFSGLHPLFYVIGEGIVIIGFLILLINQFKIKNEQKTKQDGGNKRHLRYSTPK
jgi:hypothetical protein